MKVTQDYVVALVIRSENCKVPEIVFPHEMAVLNVVHSQHGSVEMSDTTAPIPGVEFDTDEEYTRMVGRYGEIAVKEAHGSPKEFAAKFTAGGFEVAQQKPKRKQKEVPEDGGM